MLFLDVNIRDAEHKKILVIELRVETDLSDDEPQRMGRKKHGLHFSDNTSRIKNKGTKFVFFIDHFNSVASKIELEEMLSVDEQIVPTKTRKLLCVSAAQKSRRSGDTKILCCAAKVQLFIQSNFNWGNLKKLKQ